MTTIVKLFRMCLVAGLTGVMTAALAQPPSARPITLVVPFAPGISIDTVGRLLAGNMDSQFGQKMIVENRLGAGGYAGSAYVARSAPDGQTLLMSIFALAPNQFVKGLELDIGRVLPPIAVLAEAPQFLWTSGTLPVRTLGEFITYAKKEPKKLNMAINANTRGHLVALSFLRTVGVDLTLIPYNTPPTTALLTGEVHAFINSAALWRQHMAPGKVRALAVGSAGRSDLLPEIPSFKEQGVDFEAYTILFAVFGPLGMKPDLTARLNKQMYAAMKVPGMAEKLNGYGLSLPKTVETPEVLAARLEAELDEVKRLAAQFGITPQ